MAQVEEFSYLQFLNLVEFLLIDKKNFFLVIRLKVTVVKSFQIQVHEENIGGCKLYKDGETPQPCDFDTVDSSEVNVKRSVETTFISIFTMFYLQTFRKKKILLSLFSMLHGP